MSKKGQSIFSFSKANPYSSLFQDFLYHPLSSQACCCPLILKYFIFFFPRDFSNLFPSPPISPLFFFFLMSSIPTTHLTANSTNMVAVLLLFPQEVSYHSYPKSLFLWLVAPCSKLASTFCPLLLLCPSFGIGIDYLFLYSSLGDCTHPYILNCYLHIESFNSSPNFFSFLE